MFKLANNLIRINRISLLNQKYISTQSYKCEQHTDTQSNEFLPVYKFPHIRIVSLFNRMKLYQSVLTVAGMPLTFALSQTNAIDSDIFMATSIIGITGCMVLYTFGFLTDKFIGFIYISKTGNQTKISYLDFWGRRKDIIVELNDIVPLTDMKSSLTDGLYLKLQRYSVKESLKISLRYGQVLDKNGFNTVFLKELM